MLTQSPPLWWSEVHCCLQCTWPGDCAISRKVELEGSAGNHDFYRCKIVHPILGERPFQSFHFSRIILFNSSKMPNQHETTYGPLQLALSEFAGCSATWGFGGRWPQWTTIHARSVYLAMACYLGPPKNRNCAHLMANLRGTLHDMT